MNLHCRVALYPRAVKYMVILLHNLLLFIATSCKALVAGFQKSTFLQQTLTQNCSFRQNLYAICTLSRTMSVYNFGSNSANLECNFHIK